ncbi:MAG: hypothetical protein GY859_28920, partial [Desulfobacterales bacterium]|nr:hypothetical protein [Desulfobacterales bacterium]
DVGLDPSTLAGAWHRIIKERPLPPPNAAFIGGPPDKTHLAIFNRPLTPADFVRLWSL